MREVARLFLDRKLGRRAFLSRFAEMGVGGAAASKASGSRTRKSSRRPSPAVFARVGEGRPYLLDVKVERMFGGADSDWYDFFSVAKGKPRVS